MTDKPENINKYAWTFVFDRKISSPEKTLLESTSCRIKSLIEELSDSPRLRGNVACFCILHVSPNISASEFLEIASPIFKANPNSPYISFATFFKRTDILKKLIEFFKIETIEHNEINSTLLYAFETGDTESILFLLNKCPKTYKPTSPIIEFLFIAIHYSCTYNHPNIAEKALNLSTDNMVSKLIKLDNFDLIKTSLKAQSLDSLQVLLNELLRKTSLNNLISNTLKCILEESIKNNPIKTGPETTKKDFALLDEIALDKKWDKFVSPFIQHELLALAEQKKVFEAENTKEVFDISPDEKEKYQFMIDRTIKRKDGELLYKIRDLLTIPSFA